MYASRQKPRLEIVKVLPRPRLNVLMPRLGLNVMISTLRYDVTISLSITFIHSSFVYVFKTFKTKLHLYV